MEILTLVLGWAMGLFSPVVFRQIDRKRRGKELEKVLHRELRHLRYMMALTSHDLATRCSILDDGFLTDLRPAFEDPDVPEDDAKAITLRKQLLALPVSQQNAIGQAKKKPGHQPQIVEQSLPFLETQLINLDLLALDLQRQLLEIRQNVDFYNQKVRFVMEQFALTFSGDLGANHTVVTTNIEDGLGQLAKRARWICEGINRAIASAER